VASVLRPVQLVLGLCRLLVIVSLLILYVVLEPLLRFIFNPIPLLGPLIFSVSRFTLLRGSLFVAGLFWMPAERVSRKRGRISATTESWSPRKGDIIVSNWISWVEIVWLTYKFDSVFACPILRSDSTIAGFVSASWISMICSTGYPPKPSRVTQECFSLPELARNSRRPLVIFPELTTSNGRALLKFAPVFGKRTIPATECRIFLMSIRCDPPTPFRPSAASSIPSRLNPIGHCFTLCTALSLSPFLFIRLLAPSSGPSSGDLLTSEIIHQPTMDEVSEACALFISQMGRFKRVQQGWESKAKLLELYRAKKP